MYINLQAILSPYPDQLEPWFYHCYFASKHIGECSSNIAEFVVSETLFVSIINYQ